MAYAGDPQDVDVRLVHAVLPDRVTAALVRRGPVLWVLLDAASDDARRDAEELVADWVRARGLRVAS